MANSRGTFNKRARARAKVMKAQDKRRKRAERKAEAGESTPNLPSVNTLRRPPPNRDICIQRHADSYALHYKTRHKRTMHLVSRQQCNVGTPPAGTP